MTNKFMPNMKNNLTFRIESSFDFKQFIYSNCVEMFGQLSEQLSEHLCSLLYRKNSRQVVFEVDLKF